MASKEYTKNEFIKMKNELDLVERIPCSTADNEKYAQMLERYESLPNGVFKYKADESNHPNSFYTVKDDAILSDSETIQYILLQQNKNLKSIRKCVIFFTVLTIISLVIGIIAVLPLLLQ